MSIRFTVFDHNCMRLELPNLFVNVSSPLILISVCQSLYGIVQSVKDSIG